MYLKFRLLFRFVCPVFLSVVISSLILIPLGRGTPAPVHNALAQITGWQTYEDTDPRLLYAGGTWQTFGVSEAVGGTLTSTADPGATLTAYFEGTGINIIYSKGPAGGLFNGLLDYDWVEYRNSYAETYSYSHNLTFDGLDYGQHQLIIRNGEGSIWIEAIQVQGSLLEFFTTPTNTPTLEIQPSESITTQLEVTPVYFYLGDESKQLTMEHVYGTDWFYDSIEWPNLNASRNPIIGTCFTANLEKRWGDNDLQYAEMGSDEDTTPGYPTPAWISLFGDSSGPSQGIYPTCITGNETRPPGRDSISAEELCAQVCPGATRLGETGAPWPKFEDTNYVATWKIGWKWVTGELTITDMQLIYMCPWYGEYGGDHNCIYTYKPELAVDYANDYRASANDNFCSYNFYNYGGFKCTESDEYTDCANFVSQALHFGGLPMTTGWYCEKGAEYEDGQSFCGHGGQSGTWSGADANAGLPSMLEKLPGAIHITHEIIQNKDTVVIPGLDTEVEYGDDSPTTKATIIQISATLAANEITPGDVMYTYETGKTDHVILVVGWGPYLTTWDQIKANTLLYSSPSTEHPIPYVVDHGNHFLFASDKSQTNQSWAAWASGPKPYYSLPWGQPVRRDSDDPNDTSFKAGDYRAAPGPWAFIHIPTGELTFSFEEGTGTLKLEPEFNSRYLGQWNRPLRDRY